MSDEFDSTSVSCQVTSDEAGALGAEVKRNFVAAHLSIVLDIAQDAACLSTDDSVRLVKAENTVHA